MTRSLDLLGMALEVLPDSLSKLSTLTALHVNTNSLTALPEQLHGLVALQKLNVRYNLLGALPSAVGGLKALLTLDASNNKLESLPPELGCLTKCHRMSLSSNNLRTLPDEARRRPLPRALPRVAQKLEIAELLLSLTAVSHGVRADKFARGNASAR